MTDRPPDEAAHSNLLQQMLEDASHDHAKEMHRKPLEPPPVVPELPVSETKRPSKRETLLAEIEKKISAQVDEIRQQPAVQRLEAAWAALEYLVDHIDFDENVRIAFVNCSKDDLASDFDEAIDVTVSGLYRRLCEPEHHPSDDVPVTLILADYDFDHHQQDVELLRHCAAAASDAHAPFIANASLRFFGCERFAELAARDDLARLFEGSRYAAWESFRSSEDARYVALCAPGDAGLEGPASHAFAVQLAETFAQRRWFDGLTGAEDVRADTGEVALSEQQMHEISAQGMTVLRHRGDGTAAAFSASSAQQPKRFADTPEGRALALDSVAGAQLPNVLNISRVAHFIEALGHELGVSQGADSLEQALQAWLREHVPDARVRISQGDYYRYELEMRASSAQRGATVCVAGTLGGAD